MPNRNAVARSVGRGYASLTVLLLAVGWCALAIAQSDGPAEYRAYQIKHKSVAEVEALLGELLKDADMPTDLIADEKKKQILVRGTEPAQRIARQLIESIDRPPRSRAPEGRVVKAYACPPDQLKNAKEFILRRFEKPEGGIRIAADDATGQLLVLARPSVQRGVAKILGEAGFLQHDVPDTEERQSPNEVPAGSPDDIPQSLAETIERTRSRQKLRPRVDETQVGETIRLRKLESQVIARSFLKLFGKRMKWRDDGYQLVLSARRIVSITFDDEAERVLLSGPRTYVLQVSQLVRALDRSSQPGGRKTRIVPVIRSDPRKVHQALEAYRNGVRVRKAPRLQPEGSERDERSGNHRAKEQEQYGRHVYRETIELVDFQEPTADGPRRTANESEGPNDTGDDGAERETDRLRELGPDVEIDSLPDLDVMIIRGSDRDVNEITRIIQELERLSAETVPAVEVYPLKHVGGDAVARLIARVELDLVGTRQGRVLVEPLVKPNALLLIGWGEAVEAMKELIEKLDQPITGEKQLKVFRLRHAAAQNVSQTVAQMYAGTTGLEPQVTATPDVRTNSLIVTAPPREMKEIAGLLKRLDSKQGTSVNRFRVFKLKNSLAADMATTLTTAITSSATGANAKSAALELLTIDPQGERILKSGILDGAQITADPQQNALLVTAPAESMELIAALIKQLDSPAAVAQIKVFRIVNGDSGDLVEMLRALLPSQTGAAVGPQLPGAEGEPSLAPLRFAVDTRTNSIIATGSEGDLLIIETLLLRLDEKESQHRINKVYRLRNAPARDVGLAINDYLRSERQVQEAAPGSESRFQQIEREVVVVPEPVSNTLILSATTRYFEEIEKIIEDLDAQPPQVVIQVMIGEVFLNDTDETGIELGLQDSMLFDRSLLGELVTTTNTFQTSTPAGILTSTDEIIQSATNTPGFQFNNSPLGGLPNSGSSQSLSTSNTLAGQALSNFAVGRLNSELGFGGLVLAASNESVSILLRALQESRRMEILSRPQITTLDNQPAFIQIGQRVPRIVASTISQNIGQVNQIELENVGILLGVTPRISPDGTVVMDIDAEKSELAPESEGIPVTVSPEGTIVRSPRINITRAQTTVSAADGETIILGGLIAKGTSQIHRRVPWLSDVPLLGRLFQFNSVVARRTELLIIMTPRVVRSGQDMEFIKQQEAARMHWCCADVHSIHGETGMCNSMDCAACRNEVPIIYPDYNPRGDLPLEPYPEGHPTLVDPNALDSQHEDVDPSDGFDRRGPVTVPPPPKPDLPRSTFLGRLRGAWTPPFLTREFRRKQLSDRPARISLSPRISDENGNRVRNASQIRPNQSFVRQTGSMQSAAGSELQEGRLRRQTGNDFAPKKTGRANQTSLRRREQSEPATSSESADSSEPAPFPFPVPTP